LRIFLGEKCYWLKEQTLISILEVLHVACLLTLSKHIQYNVLKIAGAVMTNFNKICYHSMTEFLTLQNVQTCIYGEDVLLYPKVMRCTAEFHQGRRSLQDEPRLGPHTKLSLKKTVMLLKILYRVSVLLIADGVGISTG